MPRYLSIHLPTWSADRVRRRLGRTAAKHLARSANQPSGRCGERRDAAVLCILLTARGAGASVAPTVAAACAAALAAGVRPGASLAQARGLLFGRPLHVEPLDADADRIALDGLARAATRYSPLAAADPPDGLVLEIGGSERLFGSEAALVQAALDWLGGLGFCARAGVASTIGCAWALARFAARSGGVQDGSGDLESGDVGSDTARAAPGDERHALEPLPIAALRCTADLVEALDEMGVERIGQLLALPRWELPARFARERGAPGPLERLDQALGRRPETLERPRAPRRPRIERAFAGPVRDRTILGLALRAMLDELVERLAERGAGAAELLVELWPSDAAADAPPERLVRHTARASRDARHLWSLLEHAIERAPIGFGVERIALEARALRAARGHQVRLDGAEDPRAHAALGELVDALVARLGPRAIVGARAVEDRRPERAFRPCPALDRDAPGESRTLPVHLPRRTRPTRLFDDPSEVHVELAGDGDEQRPVALRVRGQRSELVRCIGLERLVLPWWPGAAPSAIDRALRVPPPERDPLDVRAVRDGFRVLDVHGRWSWLVHSRVFVWCRHGDGRESERVLAERWFLHGDWA